MRRKIVLCVAATLVANVALAQPLGGAPARTSAPAASGSPQPDERQKEQADALLQRACSSCHGIDLTTNRPRSRDEWTDVVSRMVGNGAQLNDDEYNLLIEYLATQYGPSRPNARGKDNASAGAKSGQD
jgi:mono/diheme cytochrome c family protein